MSYRPPGTTARHAVVQELQRLGTARNIDIARKLNLTPGAVGYILHQLHTTGHARRIRTGHYEFLKMPENLVVWDDGIDPASPPVAAGATMPQKMLSLLLAAPNGAMSFRAIQALVSLPRNVVGAVLSDLVRRGLIMRLRRGVYAIRDGQANTH